MLELEAHFDRGGLELDVELRVGDERIGIVGPSGAGKTTLLRVVAGLERGGAARVEFRDELWQGPDATFVPPWERGVGWLPQASLVFPHMNARENLRYTSPDDARFREVVEALEIGDRLEANADRLSGGERQRVALGRALLADPDLLVLDEPFAALDRPLTERIRSFVDRWCRERDCGLLVAAHTRSTVTPIVDSVHRLTDGSLQRIDDEEFDRDP